MLEVTQPAISQMENGERKVDALKLKRLAQIYGREIEYFTKTVPSAAIALFTELNLLHPSISRFVAYVFSELTEYFETAGYSTRVYHGKKIPQQESGLMGTDVVYARLMEDVAKGEVCGVVSLCAGSSYEGLRVARDWLRHLAARQIPIVGDYPSFPYTVSVNYREWIRIAIRHLIAQGRRRLAFLHWDYGGADSAEYPRIFCEEMKAHGLEANPEWMQGNIHPNHRGAGWAELREIWSSKREKPDGLIIADDQLASDACHALRELSVRVPEQLMILTHANAGCPLPLPLPVIKLEWDTVAHAHAIGSLMLRLLRRESVGQPHVVYGGDCFVLNDIDEKTDVQRPCLREISTQGSKIGKGQPVITK